MTPPRACNRRSRSSRSACGTRRRQHHRHRGHDQRRHGRRQLAGQRLLRQPLRRPGPGRRELVPHRLHRGQGLRPSARRAAARAASESRLTDSTTGQIGHVDLAGDTIKSYQKGGIAIDGAGSTAAIDRDTVTGLHPRPHRAERDRVRLRRHRHGDRQLGVRQQLHRDRRRVRRGHPDLRRLRLGAGRAHQVHRQPADRKRHGHRAGQLQLDMHRASHHVHRRSGLLSTRSRTVTGTRAGQPRRTRTPPAGLPPLATRRASPTPVTTT